MHFVSALAVGVVVWAEALSAQASNTGILQGHILTIAGSAVPLAEITVVPLEGSSTLHATTDRFGAFRVVFLAPGAYRVAVRRIGYRPISVREMVIRSGKVEVLDLALTPSAVTLDSLLVSTSSLALDRNDAEFGSRLGTRELALLPYSNDARSLAAFTPGARPDQVWGAATAQGNNYQLDGIAMNHPGIGGDLLQPSTSWIQEIQVRGLGAGAESGNFQGGIINIVTKSGTNRFEGSLRTTGESFHLNGSNLLVGESGSELSHRSELDGQVRGPIFKDRLFYALFGQVVTRGFRVLNNVRQVAGDFSPVAPEEREHKVLGKLTWQATSRDLFSGSLGHTGTSGDHFGLDGFESPEASVSRISRTSFYSLEWQRTWSPRNFLHVTFGGFDGSDRGNPYDGPAIPGIATLLEVNPRQYQNATFREMREPSSAALSLNWDVYARALGVEHHLKIGAQYDRGAWRYLKQRNGGLTWRPGDTQTATNFDPNVPSTWAFNHTITSSWGGEVDLNSQVENGGVYLQDYIQLTGRLSLNPGIRWGHWLGRLARAAGDGFFTAVSDQAFEPRIGAVFDLNGRGTFLAKAHWGRFHQGMFAAFFDRAVGGNVYSNEERWEYHGTPFLDPSTSFTLAQRNALAATGIFTKVQTIRLSEVGKVVGYHQPYVEQGILGLEKTFGEHWKAELLFVRRRNKDMVALVDKNLASNYTIYRNVTVLDRFSRPVLFKGKPVVLSEVAVSNEDILYWLNLLRTGQVGGSMFIPPGLTFEQLSKLTYGPDLTLTTAPEATRRFDQMQVALHSRHPTWWVSASATLTRLVGNLNSIAGPDDYSASGAGPFVRKNESINSFGDLNNQSPFELKVQAGGDLGRGFRGGAFLTVFGGDRVTPTLTISDLLFAFQLPDTSSVKAPPARVESFFFQTTAGQRIFVLPRGSYRYSSRTSLDLHLERSFPLGRLDVVVALDAFNALAATTVTQVQTSINGELDPDLTSAFGRTRDRLPPRTFRLGTAIHF